MTKSFVRLCLGLLLLCGLSTAFAQASRTWVSGVGDDANPCSRTAPCKTFAGAISKTAPSGTIDVLDPGGFGAVTITKSITIEANGTVAGVLVSGTNGVVISAGTGDTVVLRGLSIDGLGTGLSGVKLISAGRLVIERCIVQNFITAGLDFEPSSAAGITVSDTVVDNTASSGPGVLLQGSTSTAAPLMTLDRVRVVNNSGYGVLNKNGIASIFRSNISANYYGVKALSSSSTATITLDDTIVSNNTGAGVSSGGTAASVVISRSTINNNGSGIASGSTVQSSGDNRIFGNNGSDGAPSSSLTLR